MRHAAAEDSNLKTHQRLPEINLTQLVSGRRMRQRSLYCFQCFAV